MASEKKPKKQAYKKVPRSKEKYAALNPKRAPAIRREELEIDYLHKIKDKPEVMAWLNQFTEEHVIANFGKKDDPKAIEKLLDKSPEHRKACYDRNNARNRDELSRAKARRLITRIESDEHWSHFVDNDGTNYNHHEDHLVTLLDEARNPQKDED